MPLLTTYIRPAKGDWIPLENTTVDVFIQRRMTRTVTHGGEGDDLIDEGAESAVYTIKGEMDVNKYRLVMKLFRSGQPFIHDPYIEKEIKVVFSKLRYKGETGDFMFELVEDIK